MSFPRMAALGAFAASAGLAVLFLGFVWLTLPRYTGGINGGTATVAWISVGLIILALIAVHLVYARVLWNASRATERA